MGAEEGRDSFLFCFPSYRKKNALTNTTHSLVQLRDRRPRPVEGRGVHEVLRVPRFEGGESFLLVGRCFLSLFILFCCLAFRSSSVLFRTCARRDDDIARRWSTRRMPCAGREDRGRGRRRTAQRVCAYRGIRVRGDVREDDGVLFRASRSVELGAGEDVR